jgi:hypothetical protein
MTPPGVQHVVPVPGDLLRALADEAPVDERKAVPPPPANGNGTGHREYKSKLLVERWLSDRGVTHRVKPELDNRGRRVFVLAQCPFNHAHGDPDSCIMQDPNTGQLSAQCFHDGCRGHGWQHFKEAIGKPDPGHYDPPLGRSPRTTGLGGRLAKAHPNGDGHAGTPPADGARNGNEDGNVHLTDRGNGARFARQHGENSRHCWPWHKWLLWDGTRWRLDEEGEAARRAKAVIDDLFAWTVQEMAKVRDQLKETTE